MEPALGLKGTPGASSRHCDTTGALGKEPWGQGGTLSNTPRQDNTLGTAGVHSTSAQRDDETTEVTGTSPENRRDSPVLPERDGDTPGATGTDPGGRRDPQPFPRADEPFETTETSPGGKRAQPNTLPKAQRPQEGSKDPPKGTTTS